MSLSITDIEVSELRIPGLDDLAHAGSNWTCLVRVETNAGIEGIAEVTDVDGLARRMYELSYWHGASSRYRRSHRPGS